MLMDDNVLRPWHRSRMRTTHDHASVRLYHLGDGPEGGSADTLFYGPLSEALRIAAEQPLELQEELFIATDNDVVAYLDLIEG
ncbi:hypothetical protein NJ75_01907 [Novosphingobium subterraneum]|uniref:Uncharacterized protein n=2 Tax=Novosphingobium subterraneum TaxID=48936 RepID=A0A0B8ZKD5_9SPHN|nr:hypothetical protein NJ75_01907 [Novosphingobium subterraneum]